MNSHQGRLAVLLVGLVALATLPFWAHDPYQVHLATLIGALPIVFLL